MPEGAGIASLIFSKSELFHAPRRYCLARTLPLLLAEKQILLHVFSAHLSCFPQIC